MLAQMPLFHTLLLENWALFETSLLVVGVVEGEVEELPSRLASMCKLKVLKSKKVYYFLPKKRRIIKFAIGK